MQITRLRRKIEPDPRMPRYLQTVRGQGYVLWPIKSPEASRALRLPLIKRVLPRSLLGRSLLIIVTPLIVCS